MIRQLFILLLAFPTALLAQPSNDNWRNASEIKVNDSGFGTGLFNGQKINLKDASIELSESFNSTIKSVALHQKTVWYKFTLATSRDCEVILRQNDTLIQPLDIGFSVYKNTNHYPSPFDFSAHLPSISQQGASTNSCLPAGTYYVQVCGRNRVKDSIWIDLKLQSVSSSGNMSNSPLNIINSSQPFYLNDCYSIENKDEQKPFLIDDISKSAYLEFTTPKEFNTASLYMTGSNSGFIVYKGDLNTDTSKWQPIIVQSWFEDAGIYNRTFNCELFEFETKYTIKLFAKSDGYLTVSIPQFRGNGKSLGPSPLSAHKLGTVSQNINQINFNTNIDCKNRAALELCKTYHNLLWDTLQLFNGTEWVKSPAKETVGAWATFTLNSPATLQWINFLNSTIRYKKFFLFKGTAKTSECNLGAPEQGIGQCLEAGEYTILITANPHSYTTQDTVWNYFRGFDLALSIHFKFPILINTNDLAKYPSPKSAYNLGNLNKGQTVASKAIPSDWLNAPKRAYIFEKDTVYGHFSFIKFQLDHKAFVKLEKGPSSIYYTYFAKILKVDKQEDPQSWTHVQSEFNGNYFSTGNWSKTALEAGEYMLVFYRYVKSPCDDLYLHKTNHILMAYDEKPIIHPPNPTDCKNQHQWAKTAMRFNNGKTLDLNYKNPDLLFECIYELAPVCALETHNLNYPHWYNYEEYKKNISGFLYTTINLEDLMSIQFTFNAPFQLVKGDIKSDSIGIFKEKHVIVEYSYGYEQVCYLKPGVYTVIFVTNGSSISGKLKCFPSGYTKNNYAQFSEDLGLLKGGFKTVSATGIISCKTDFDLTNPIATRNNWHTFRAVGPCKIRFPRQADDVTFQVYQSVNGNHNSFDQLQKLRKVDSSYLDSQFNWQFRYYYRNNSYEFDILSHDTFRYYILAYERSKEYTKYQLPIAYIPDTAATFKGDSCKNPAVFNINGTGDRTLNAYTSIHTIGEGPGEKNPSNWHSLDNDQLKSTWYRLDVSNNAGNKMKITKSSGQNPIYTMRVLYGDCKALTPGPVLEYANSGVILDCLSNGNYYMQILHDKNYKGEIGVDINTSFAFGACKNIDLKAVIANFEMEGGCNRDSVKFTNNSTTGENMRYEWDFGDGNTSKRKNPSHLYKWSNKLDTYNIQLVAINILNKASDTFRRQLVIGELKFSAGLDSVTCDSRITMNPIVPYKDIIYEWRYVYNNNSLSNITSYEERAILTTFADTSQYQLTLRLGNCTSSDTVKYFAPFHHGIQQNSFICDDDSVLISGNKKWKSKIIWNNKDTLDSIWIKKAGSYSYRVQLEHCSYPVTKQIQKSVKPNAIVIDKACNNSKYFVNNVDRDWWISSGNIFGTNSIFIKDSLQYPIQWIHRFGQCPNILDTIHLKKLIHIPTLLKDTTVCGYTELMLQTGDSATNFSWSTGDTTSSIKVDKPGFYTVQMLKDICYQIDTSIVTFYPSVNISVEDKTHCFEEGPLTISANTSHKILWSTGDTFNQIEVLDSGQYWVKAYSDNCDALDSFTISKYCAPKFFIPNAFTPNGDGINPEFVAKGFDVLSFEMTIYARNGQRIFYSDKLEKGWDGTLLGEVLPVGKYYYIINYKTKEGAKQQVGQIALIK